MQSNKKLSVLSYCAFFYLGILYTNWGIYLLYMHSTYHITITTLGYLFVIPSLFQGFTTYLNGHFLNRVNLKTQLSYSLLLTVISLGIMASSHTILLLIIAMILIGIAFGIMEGLINYIIVTIFPTQKFSKLNVLNFFYSFGAIVGPAYAGILLNISWPWQWVMFITLLFGIFLLFFNSKISYGTFGNPHENPSDTKIIWHFSIYLIAASMVLYVLSGSIFSFWIVAYLQKTYGFSIGLASFSLTLFWIFIAAGRALSGIFKKLKIYNFIMVFALIAFFANIGVLFIHSATALFILIPIMGIGNSCLYASTLAYGTEQLKYNCPKLLSVLVVASNIGLILAFPLSTFFVHNFGMFISLLIGALLMVVLVVVILLTLLDKNNPYSTKYQSH